MERDVGLGEWDSGFSAREIVDKKGWVFLYRRAWQVDEFRVESDAPARALMEMCRQGST